MTRIINLTVKVEHRITGERLLTQTIGCDTEGDTDTEVQERIEDAINWYGRKQGRALKWEAREFSHTARESRVIARGSWGVSRVIRNRRRLAAV